MSYSYFDPSTSTDLAKFQGTFAGIQAGNASYCGTSMAPTSIYNQAGYYALQDSDTGYVSLKKLGDESIYTNAWYDQGTDTTFDFSSSSSSSVSSTSSSSDDDEDDTTSTYSSYPYGTGYVVSSSSSDDDDDSTTTSSSTSSTSTTTTSTDDDTDYVTDEDGNVIEVTAEDLQDMVDSGIYNSLAEALEATLAAGYYVSEEDQAELGLYTDEDEEKIQQIMSVYGLSREDAIDSLESSGIISDSSTQAYAEELREALDEVQADQGFIGKAWNGLKEGIESLFDTDIGVTYEDCEYAIEEFEEGTITYDEAATVIEEYAERQESATDGIKTGAAVVAGVAAGALSGGLLSGVAIGAVAGATVKTTAGVADRASNENDEDDGLNSEVAQDVLTGAAAGAVSAAGTKVVSKGAKGVKSLIGKIFKHS